MPSSRPNVRPPLGKGFDPPHRSDADPRIVWAFGDPAEPDGTLRWPLGGAAIWQDTVADRGLIRIQFAVPDEQMRTWDEFCAEQLIRADWRRYLEGKRQGQPERWRIVLGPVPRKRWRAIEARASDSDPWTPVQGWGLGLWKPAAEAEPRRIYDKAGARAHLESIKR